MPVKNDEESDGGEVTAAESEHSNSSQGSSDEASDDSSDLDDSTEIERRRTEYLTYLENLESQFHELRNQYYNQRMSQIEYQLAEVREGRSLEFLQPLKELEKVYQERMEVAKILKKYRLKNIEHIYYSEIQAARQNFESEKELTYDQIYSDLMEKIRRLEEDRHNVDITWADWNSDKRTSKVRGPGRKKPVTVTGPYIVYMLRDEDIMEDWTVIRKAMKRTASGTCVVPPSVAT